MAETLVSPWLLNASAERITRTSLVPDREELRRRGSSPRDAEGGKRETAGELRRSKCHWTVRAWSSG